MGGRPATNHTPHRDFKERNAVVLPVAHPWESASSISLRSPSSILAATHLHRDNFAGDYFHSQFLSSSDMKRT